jgi:hypothetical protein
MEAPSQPPLSKCGCVCHYLGQRCVSYSPPTHTTHRVMYLNPMFRGRLGNRFKPQHQSQLLCPKGARMRPVCPWG